jgi:hypothetical protein
MQDLIPATTAAGYLPAYVNLWDNRDHPGEALVAALYGAMQTRDSKDSRGALAKALGLEEPVNKSTPQNALT